MGEYRVGDRVRFIDGKMWPDLVGLEGTVVGVPFPKTASVQLDTPPWASTANPCAWASDIEPVV